MFIHYNRIDWGDLQHRIDRITPTAFPSLRSHESFIVYANLNGLTSSNNENDVVEVAVRGVVGGREITWKIPIQLASIHRSSILSRLAARSQIR